MVSGFAIVVENFKNRLNSLPRTGMRRASSQILPVLSSFTSLFRLQKWTELNHPSAGAAASWGVWPCNALAALTARWASYCDARIARVVIATSRIPRAPYGLWPA